MAKRLGISAAVVRRWVKRGIVRCEIERYGAHPFVWWLHIDKAAAVRLTRAAKQSLRH